MAGGLRVIGDMRVVFCALVMAACVFHDAQCEDGEASPRRAPRRAPRPDKGAAASDQTDNDDGRKNAAPRVLKLSEDPVCAADVSRICGKITGQNNFAVVECLQNDLMKDEEISDACEHLVWSYKHNLTMDFRFDSAASEICKTTLDLMGECSGLPDGQGLKIPCLIENIDNVTNNNCKAFLKRMESIVFSDYRLIFKFADKCRSEIGELECGRLPSNEDNALPHNQGRTLTCLAEHLDKLNDDCKQELLRVAELQADDYHKDRQLYYACREDRENFCHKVKAGEGRIYKCLFRHKFDPQMSDGCLKMLTVRQQLQQEDYKVNMKFARSCQADIIENKCLPQMEAVAPFKNARLSAILLCLEGAMKDGKEVNPDCIGELKEVRRSLMEDYQISPILVRDCSKEIQENCGGGLHRDGKTIHCLMDLARPKKNRQSNKLEVQISDICVRALEDVLEEADVGDNYEVDPAIQEDCEPVVKVLCKDIRPGEGRIMNCLVESLDKPHMTDLCRERLMEIYFFITRDFRLDTRLYKLCRQDAKTICQAPDAWYLPSSKTNGEQYRPAMKQLVFACLYRHLVQVSSDPSYKPLSRPCGFEVKRVMRERALSVDLDPQIADACLFDLGEKCSDKTQKSEEMECLEDNLETLQPGCKKLISEYADAADVAPELNDIFQLSCAPFWDKYCPQAIQNDFKKKKEHDDEKDESDDDNDSDDNDDDDEKSDDEIGENLMSCLIQYKYHPKMDEKCRAGIEHHQLITAKNFSFSHQFSEACKFDVASKCPLAKDRSQKSYVVQCLSEFVRNDTFSDVKHRVTKQCRKQLKFELLQRSSNIKLDPDLEKACKSDVESKCQGINPGKAAVIQCLRKNQKDLSETCHSLIFKREQEEAQLPMTDYLLMSKCKSMIKRYCVEEMTSPETIFECLQRNKEESNFDKGCFDAVIAREELKAKDIRLNPILEKSCLADAKKLCKSDLQNRLTDKEDEGHVLLCLRKQFAKKRLSETCEEHMREVIIESAKDYRQDLELVKTCEEEIKLHCIEFVTDTKKIDNGRVENCLKDLFEKNGILPSSKCYDEVVRIIEESQADIHADVRLFKVCSVDLKQHCADVVSGSGRKMNCLVTILNDKKIPLDEKCNRTLSQRIQLWKKVPGADPEMNFQKMASDIVTSPSRNYFVGVILVFIGIIFIGGLFCGRVTKRIRREIKDR